MIQALLVAWLLVCLMGYIYATCVMGLGELAPEALILVGALVLVLAVAVVARWVE